MRTLRDLLRLALSVLVGQLAVIGFGGGDAMAQVSCRQSVPACVREPGWLPG
jgi:hypothetical protein